MGDKNFSMKIIISKKKETSKPVIHMVKLKSTENVNLFDKCCFTDFLFQYMVFDIYFPFSLLIQENAVVFGIYFLVLIFFSFIIYTNDVK